MVVSGVTYVPAVACSPLLDSQMQIKKSAIQYTGNCGTLCTVKTLENGDGTSDAPRPRWPRTHSTTRVTRVQRRAPHRNHVSTGPCPGRAADNPKDVPNAALILLWLSSSQGLPVPQGPCTQRKYTYLNNPPRCLSFVRFISPSIVSYPPKQYHAGAIHNTFLFQNFPSIASVKCC